MRRALPFGLSLLLAATCAQAARTRDDWPVYINVLHHYHVCYPRGLLVPQGETDNSTGQAFRSADGAELAVWGAYSVDDKTLRQTVLSYAANAAEPAGRITYSAFGKNWGVASGENGDGGIFYIKILRRRDRLVTAELRYPQAKAAQYRSVTERIARCFGLAPDIPENR